MKWGPQGGKPWLGLRVTLPQVPGSRGQKWPAGCQLPSGLMHVRKPEAGREERRRSPQASTIRWLQRRQAAPRAGLAPTAVAGETGGPGVVPGGCLTVGLVRIYLLKK